MNQLIKFFGALSECYCDTYPETLAAFKHILTLAPGQVVDFETKCREYILVNKDAILTQDKSLLTPFILFYNIPAIDLVQILGDAQTGDNAAVIWAHLQLILKSYIPDAIVQPIEESSNIVAKPPISTESAMGFIEKIVDTITHNLPPMHENATPKEILESLLHSDTLLNAFDTIQSEFKQMQENTSMELSPENILMCATQMMMKRR